MTSGKHSRINGQDTRPPISLKPGMILGKQELVRPIASGAMAHVWVARSFATGANLAVKVLRAEHTRDRAARERLRAEASTASRLQHRAIIRVYDVVEVPGALAIVMELLEGETLDVLLDRVKRLELEDAAAVVLPILSALAHAHAIGIVHGDLRPRNVFLSRESDGEIVPKLIDFGMSKFDGPRAGADASDEAPRATPYTAPEQIRGSPDVGPPCDVFAMGALLHRILSGSSPFEGGSYGDVVSAVLERDVPAIEGLHPRIASVLGRCLVKAADGRYENAGELRSAIEGAFVEAAISFDRPGQRLSFPKVRAALEVREPATKPHDAIPPPRVVARPAPPVSLPPSDLVTVPPPASIISLPPSALVTVPPQAMPVEPSVVVAPPPVVEPSVVVAPPPVVERASAPVTGSAAAPPAGEEAEDTDQEDPPVIPVQSTRGLRVGILVAAGVLAMGLAALTWKPGAPSAPTVAPAPAGSLARVEPAQAPPTPSASSVAASSPAGSIPAPPPSAAASTPAASLEVPRPQTAVPGAQAPTPRARPPLPRRSPIIRDPGF